MKHHRLKNYINSKLKDRNINITSQIKYIIFMYYQKSINEIYVQ